MKDLLLILVTLATFAFGYFVVVKTGAFFDENQRLTERETRHNRPHIRIAAESPALLNAITPQLEACSSANPCLEFFLSTGKAERILQKLNEGSLDIALLSDETAARIGKSYGSVRILCQAEPVYLQSLNLPVEAMEGESWIHVVWNREIFSKERDRVVFALEAEYCTLKHGYADYLD